MSAQEFAEWFVFLSREELLPSAERIRSAQLRAAVLTGPAKAPRGRGGWSHNDLIDTDVWREAQTAVPAAPLSQQIAALNARIK